MVPKSTIKCDLTNEKTVLIDLDQMFNSLNSVREIYGSSDSINQILNSNYEILGDDFNINIQDHSQNMFSYPISAGDHINRDVLNTYEQDVIMQENEPPLLEPILNLGSAYVIGENSLKNSQSAEPDEIIIKQRSLISESQYTTSPADKENKGSSSQQQLQQSSHLLLDVQPQDSHRVKTEDENVPVAFLTQEHHVAETKNTFVDTVKTEGSVADDFGALYKFPEASGESNSTGTKD
ncbi:5299_t:CDS:2, partial [Scutellospora calospora]